MHFLAVLYLLRRGALRDFLKSFIKSLKILRETVGEIVLIVKISVHDGEGAASLYGYLPCSTTSCIKNDFTNKNFILIERHHKLELYDNEYCTQMLP